MSNRNQKKGNASTDGISALRSAIAKHLFFRGLDAVHLDALTNCARQTKFPSNDIIFHQGNIANHFFLIEEGCIALEIDQLGRGAIPIQTLGAGEAFGWSWLFSPHIWRFSVRSISPTQVIVFKGNQLRAQFAMNPDLCNELVKRTAHVVVERLQATQMQLVQISQVAMRGKRHA